MGRTESTAVGGSSYSLALWIMCVMMGYGVIYIATPMGEDALKSAATRYVSPVNIFVWSALLAAFSALMAMKHPMFQEAPDCFIMIAGSSFADLFLQWQGYTWILYIPSVILVWNFWTQPANKQSRKQEEAAADGVDGSTYAFILMCWIIGYGAAQLANGENGLKCKAARSVYPVDVFVVSCVYALGFNVLAWKHPMFMEICHGFLMIAACSLADLALKCQGYMWVVYVPAVVVVALGLFRFTKEVRLWSRGIRKSLDGDTAVKI